MSPATSATTVRYLFASTWAPPAGDSRSMDVPGAKVPGLDTAANLLEIAVWSLREQGLADVQQIRPVERKKVTVMGGKSFTRFTVFDASAKLPGLEGALIEAWRGSQGPKGMRGIDEALAKLLSGDEADGLRSVILALGLKSTAPWASVAAYCADEARAAGVDSAALESLKERDAEIVAARTAYREREPELDEAVISDCVAAVDWAHTGSPD